MVAPKLRTDRGLAEKRDLTGPRRSPGDSLGDEEGEDGCMAQISQITPFRISVPDADLDDLRARLARTRWPEAECVDDWSQGIPLALHP